MVHIPDEIKEVFDRQRMIPLGTCSRDGTPNTIYIGSWWWISPDTMLVVDNFFNKTRRNLDENPRASLLTWSNEKKKSYQIKCSAIVKTNGPEYDQAFQRERGRNDFYYPCKAVALLKVEEIYDAWYGEGAGKRLF